MYRPGIAGFPYYLGINSLEQVAARQDRVSLKNPPKSVDEYLADLERAGIPRTVAALRPFSERL